jgi:type IV secretion system protein VirB9
MEGYAMKKLALALLASCVVAGPVASQIPVSSAKDSRIRYVRYDADNVVQLDGVIGIATHIILQDGETYVTHAFGDADAWSFAIERNHVFIKPKADHADTNLVIVTDRRSYNFRLNYIPTRKANAVYQLAFTYPETPTARTAAVEKAATDAAFSVSRGKPNLKYTMSGDYSIAPVNVWDNGEFTFFKFPGNRDVPAIYMVDAAGKESIVNRNTTGAANDVVVVQKINPKFYLRLGNQALAVFNEAFDPYGVPNNTGTSSPAVERVLKGDAQ